MPNAGPHHYHRSNNWTLLPAVFGSTASAPATPTVVGTYPAPGSAPQATFYSYVVTSIDANGQESSPSPPGALGPEFDIRSVAGSNQISWAAIPGAVAYNVYEADVSYFGVVPAGASYGFIGTTVGTVFVDSNIGPDFSQTPPIAKNPFQGEGVASVAVTVAGTYTTVPTVSFTGAVKHDCSFWLLQPYKYKELQPSAQAGPTTTLAIPSYSPTA